MAQVEMSAVVAAMQALSKNSAALQRAALIDTGALDRIRTLHLEAAKTMIRLPRIEIPQITMPTVLPHIEMPLKLQAQITDILKTTVVLPDLLSPETVQRVRELAAQGAFTDEDLEQVEQAYDDDEKRKADLERAIVLLSRAPGVSRAEARRIILSLVLISYLVVYVAYGSNPQIVGIYGFLSLILGTSDVKAWTENALDHVGLTDDATSSSEDDDEEDEQPQP